jgi:hypothetical protein
LSPTLDALMIGLTVIGLAALPAIAIVVCRDERRVRLALVSGIVISLAIVLGVQWVGARPRPSGVRLILAQPGFFAYPSGHVAIVVCTAVIMRLASRRRRLAWVSAVVAGAIAYSRAYLGHHHPSDVLGGAIVGAAIGAACYGLVILPRPDWRWLLWPQVALVVVITQMAYLGLLPTHLLSWPYADKLFHFVLFGAVVFWLDPWLSPKQICRIPLSIAVVLVLAMAEEFAQHASPRRSADIADLVCDVAGMLAFYWLSRRLRGRLSVTPHPGTTLCDQMPKA